MRGRPNESPRILRTATACALVLLCTCDATTAPDATSSRVSLRFDFEEPSKRSLRPGFEYLVRNPTDEWSSESPLDSIFLRKDGGALGSSGYLALVRDRANQFYVEVTPYWWTPSRTFDLRQGHVSSYLKDVQAITIADPSFQPRLFIASFDGDGYTTAIYGQPLTVGAGGAWAYNSIQIDANPTLWTRFQDTHVVTPSSLDVVLANAEFIGIIYYSRTLDTYLGVGATGTLGIDAFAFDGVARN